MRPSVRLRKGVLVACLVATLVASGSILPAQVNIGNLGLLEQVERLQGEVTPPGTIAAFAGKDVPRGWLLCNGQSLRGIEYPRLFAAIGTTFGGSETEGMFGLPDLTGRVIVGTGQSPRSDRSVRNLGDAGGEERHQLTVDELPSHKHNVKDAGHHHSIPSADDANNRGGNTIVNNDRGPEHSNAGTNGAHANI